MSDLKLYNYFRSSTSYRVRIALHYKNLNFEYKPIHLLNNGGEQNSTEYRHINPIGGVPTLIHNQYVISQSFAIIEYLDEAFPNTPQLINGSVYDRAKIRQLCENINADIHPLQNLKVMQYLEKQHQYDQQQKNSWCQKWIVDGLQATEKLIESLAVAHNEQHKMQSNMQTNEKLNTDIQYCYGTKITAADLFLIPQMVSAERFLVDIKQFKTLYQIYQNCLTISAFQKAHPFCQVDTPDDLKKTI